MKFHHLRAKGAVGCESNAATVQDHIAVQASFQKLEQEVAKSWKAVWPWNKIKPSVKNQVNYKGGMSKA